LTSIDWFSILIYLFLVGLGLMNVYASSYTEGHKGLFDITQLYGKQAVWILASFVLAILIMVVDSRAYHAFGYIIYGLAILSLLAVIFTTATKGARAWFAIADYKLQPGEFAKIAVNLALAKYLSSFEIKNPDLRHFFIPIGILFVPMLLIVLSNDTGSALVYLAFVVVLYREGLYWWIPALGLLAALLFILALTVNPVIISICLVFIGFAYYGLSEKEYKKLGIGFLIFIGISSVFEAINQIFNLRFKFENLVLFGSILSAIIYLILAFINRIKFIYLLIALFIGSMLFMFSVNFIFNNVFENHQQTRIKVFLGLEDDERGVGYNVNQSIIAIGSGGITGKGFLQGTQTKFNFVPEQSTDFIFCTMGEEWGFAGTTFVIVLFIILFLRLIFLAERQRSSFSRIYGYGVTSILFFHFVVNVGMTIGLMPIIGIPLPFFSYGGSSLWSSTMLLFIFLRLDSSRNELL